MPATAITESNWRRRPGDRTRGHHSVRLIWWIFDSDCRFLSYISGLVATAAGLALGRRVPGAVLCGFATDIGEREAEIASGYWGRARTMLLAPPFRDPTSVPS